MQDYSTAIFDLDPQQTLSDASDFRAEDEQEPVLNVISPKSKVYEKLIEAGKEYTEVLVDIGNSNMNAVRQAYRAADRIVVPVLPSQADVWSTSRFRDIVEETIAGKKNARKLSCSSTGLILIRECGNQMKH